jgi:hypothetical protein
MINSIEKGQLRLLSSPTLSPFSVITCLKREVRCATFSSERVRFYHQARYAIWHAIRLLGLRPGDNVAIPAFQCGTEIDPFIHSGIQIRFYRVDRSLKVDLDSVKSILDSKTRSLLIVHYFGFPQDMRSVQLFCRENRLLLIEDCAHLLNGQCQEQPLGAFGDVSVFSMRKLLPIPDGGALLINNRDIPMPNACTAPPIRPILGMALVKITRHLGGGQGKFGRIIKISILDPALRFSRRVKYRDMSPAPANDSPFVFRIERVDWGMSKLSEKLIHTTDIEWVIRQRRENFNHLLANIKASEHIEPLFDDLPKAVCPLAFPVLVKEPEAFDQYLASCGIEIARSYEYFHPDFPKERFPDETFLKEHIRILPVHQELDGASMGSMINVLNAWRGSGNPVAQGRAGLTRLEGSDAWN